MFLSIRGRVLIKGYGLESLQDSGVLEIIELQKELELERTTTVTLLIWMMSLSLRRRDNDTMIRTVTNRHNLDVGQVPKTEKRIKLF